MEYYPATKGKTHTHAGGIFPGHIRKDSYSMWLTIPQPHKETSHRRKDFSRVVKYSLNQIRKDMSKLSMWLNIPLPHKERFPFYVMKYFPAT
jgi:hypothetical protein